jgi:hypothetical protein
MTENIHTALLAIQTILTNPIKTQDSKQFVGTKYAMLPDIRDQVTPILANAGMYLTQLVQYDDAGRSFLESVITHSASGTSITSKMPLMLDKQTPQGMGSAITYARRYALCAMLNIAADKDDDGESGSVTPQQPKPAPKKDRMPQPLFDEHYAALKGAGSINELAETFKVAWYASGEYSDKSSQNELKLFYDKRKAELERQ